MCRLCGAGMPFRSATTTHLLTRLLFQTWTQQHVRGRNSSRGPWLVRTSPQLRCRLCVTFQAQGVLHWRLVRWCRQSRLTNVELTCRTLGYPLDTGVHSSFTLLTSATNVCHIRSQSTHAECPARRSLPVHLPRAAYDPVDRGSAFSVPRDRIPHGTHVLLRVTLGLISTLSVHAHD
jgi:hypothetical protein